MSSASPCHLVLCLSLVLAKVTFVLRVVLVLFSAIVLPTSCCHSPCDTSLLRVLQTLGSSWAMYFIVPHVPSAAWGAKTMPLSYSHIVGSPVHGFKQLPFTFPGKGSPFNLTNCTTPLLVIPLIIYNPKQCILNFLGNLSNLLSQNRTKLFTLNVCILICQSCHAFSRCFGPTGEIQPKIILLQAHPTM